LKHFLLSDSTKHYSKSLCNGANTNTAAPRHYSSDEICLMRYTNKHTLDVLNDKLLHCAKKTEKSSVENNTRVVVVCKLNVKLKSEIKGEQYCGRFPDSRTTYSRRHAGDFILRQYPLLICRVVWRCCSAKFLRRGTRDGYSSSSKQPVAIPRRVRARSHSEQQLDNFGDPRFRRVLDIFALNHGQRHYTRNSSARSLDHRERFRTSERTNL